MSGLSEKEQAKILRHFLLSSPPGQFGHVERALRKLSPGDLIDRSLPAISKRYNEDQCLPQSVSDTENKVAHFSEMKRKISFSADRDYEGWPHSRDLQRILRSHKQDCPDL